MAACSLLEFEHHLARPLVAMRAAKACPRALVVDDDQDAADTFAALLKTLACEATAITDPSRAVEMVERIGAEVAFLDIAMPGMDGIELARLLRAKYGWQKLSLIAVTAHREDEIRIRSRQAGFDAYVVKPVDIEIVKSTLQTMFPESRWL